MKKYLIVYYYESEYSTDCPLRIDAENEVDAVLEFRKTHSQKHYELGYELYSIHGIYEIAKEFNTETLKEI